MSNARLRSQDVKLHAGGDFEIITYTTTCLKAKEAFISLSLEAKCI